MNVAARSQGRTARSQGTWASAARLLAWLGPWGGERVPRSVRRTAIEVARAGEGAASEPWRRAPSMRAYVYEPAGRPTGAYLVAQGLHFAGPDDPRLDRFCRVLAAGGHLVLAPFLPAFGALIVDPSAGDDLALAFDELERRARPLALPRPAVLSISFGSLAAAHLATLPSHRDRLGGWLSFGGYSDFGATLRFALTGRYHHEGRPVAAAHDPLNAPVVFLNIVRHLEAGALAPDRHAAFGDALREVARLTWGKMERAIPSSRPSPPRSPRSSATSSAWPARPFLALKISSRPASPAPARSSISPTPPRSSQASAPPSPSSTAARTTSFPGSKRTSSTPRYRRAAPRSSSPGSTATPAPPYPARGKHGPKRRRC